MNVRDANLPQQLDQVDRWNRLSLSDEDPKFIEEFNRVINKSSIPEVDDKGPEIKENVDIREVVPGHAYINMEIGLPRGDDDEIMRAVVKRKRLDNDGNHVGTANNNPLVDSRAYEVE